MSTFKILYELNLCTILLDDVPNTIIIMPSICFISTYMHLDNDINNFQKLQVCPSSINIEEVTQKTVNILTNRFGFQPIGQLFNNSANSCSDLKNIRSGIKSGYYWIYSRGLSSRKYCNFQ